MSCTLIMCKGHTRWRDREREGESKCVRMKDEGITKRTRYRKRM